MKYENLTGLSVEEALRRLEGRQTKVVDFSRPDKYHTDIKPSLRVVKAEEKDGAVILFAAGFKDEI